MERELDMVRDVYKTAARRNMQMEHFWKKTSERYGFEPLMIDPELMVLRELTEVDQLPEEPAPDDRNVMVVGLFSGIIHIFVLLKVLSNEKKGGCCLVSFDRYWLGLHFRNIFSVF